MGWPFKSNNVANTDGAAPEPSKRAPMLPSLTDEAVQERARAQSLLAVTGRGRKSTFLTSSLGDPLVGRKSTLSGGF
jgi:hypothetical protein